MYLKELRSKIGHKKTSKNIFTLDGGAAKKVVKYLSNGALRSMMNIIKSSKK